MDVSEAERLKQLEDENVKLKKLLALIARWSVTANAGHQT
jgi:hypothetical protein